MLTMIGAGLLLGEEAQRYVDALGLGVVVDPRGLRDAEHIETAVNDKIRAFHVLERTFKREGLRFLLKRLAHRASAKDPFDMIGEAMILAGAGPKIGNAPDRA